MVKQQAVLCLATAMIVFAGSAAYARATTTDRPDAAAVQGPYEPHPADGGLDLPAADAVTAGRLDGARRSVTASSVSSSPTAAVQQHVLNALRL